MCKNLYYHLGKFKYTIKSYVRERNIKPELAYYGELNPDKKFYVIENKASANGLFTIIRYNLSHIRYAIDNGLIPIIDMKTYNGQYSRKDGENAWEYFFKQPCGYGLDDAYKSRNVYRGECPQVKYGIDVYIPKFFRKRLCTESILWKKYIIPQESIQKFMKDEYTQLIEKGDRVLGVLCRGSDYLREFPPYHFVQPDPQQVIQKVKNMRDKLCYSKIYLATEDKEIHSMFKNEFGKIVIDNSQPLVEWNESVKGNVLSQVEWNGKGDKTYIGLKYLSSMNILSKCQFFIGGMTAGTIGAFLMQEKPYEYEYIWRMGLYPPQKINNK